MSIVRIILFIEKNITN